jgi:hypothetical protein
MVWLDSIGHLNQHANVNVLAWFLVRRASAGQHRDGGIHSGH